MATITFQRGSGGGKVKPKRITRSWMIDTILAQQTQLDKFSQLLLESQRLVNDLQGHKEVVCDSLHANTLPVANKPARSGGPESYLESVNLTI